jgi:hypothetical protein
MNDDLTVLRCWACGGEGWRDESRGIPVFCMRRNGQHLLG